MRDCLNPWLFSRCLFSHLCWYLFIGSGSKHFICQTYHFIYFSCDGTLRRYASQIGPASLSTKKQQATWTTCSPQIQEHDHKIYQNHTFGIFFIGQRKSFTSSSSTTLFQRKFIPQSRFLDLSHHLHSSISFFLIYLWSQLAGYVKRVSSR